MSYKEKLGNAGWKFLHLVAKGYPESPTFKEQNNMEQFIHYLSKIYPCKSCRYHFKIYLSKYPVNTSNKFLLQKWFCNFHNSVNKRLNKKIYNCN